MSKQAIPPLLLGILLAWPVNSTADARLQVLALERQLDADKRGIVTLRMEVENRSSTAREFQESLQLPEGWSLLSTAAPFTLMAGQRELRLLHVLVPNQSAAGQFPLTYQLQALNDSSLYSQETVQVAVQALMGIQLSRLAVPANLLAGEAYQAQFLLTNTGNLPQQYRIRLHDSDGYALQITPAQLQLSPGASQTITLKGKVAEQPDTEVHRLTLMVYGAGQPVEESLNIPIIPNNPQGIGTHHRLDGELGLGYLANQQQTGSNKTTQQQATLDYRLRGALDPLGEHRVDLHLRTGRAFDQPFASDQTQYQLRYENDDWQVKAGDQSFYTHRLLGNSLSGTGIEARYQGHIATGQATASSVRAFHGQSNHAVDESVRTSALIGNYQLSDQLELSAALLHHEQDPINTTNTSTNPHKTIKNLASLETHWGGEQVDVSAAFAHDGDHQAIALDTTARYGKLSSHLNYLRGDSDFAGAYADTEQLNLGGQWQTDDKTRLSAQARQTRNNLSADNSREIRNDYEYRLRAERAIGINADTQIGIGLRHRDEHDQRAISTTDQTLTAASLNYQKQLADLNLSAQIELGKRQSYQAAARLGHRQQLAFSWRPTERWNIAADYSHDAGLTSTEARQTLGLRTDYRLPDQQEWSGYLQLAQAEDNPSLTANLSYRKPLKKQHKLALGLSHRQTTTTDNKPLKDTSIQVDYTLPLDLPLRKRKDIATLCGQLFDAETRLPLSGMVLNLESHATVTDPQGKFCYPNVLAKDYRLQLDPSRLAGRSYSFGEENLGKAIHLQAGEQRHLKLMLYPAAGLSGQVLSFSHSALLSQQALAGAAIPHVPLELRPMGSLASTAKPLFRETDAEGRFNVIGLAPGTWQLVINNQQALPKHYRLEQNQWQLELKAGQVQELTIRAVPQQQDIEKTGPTEGFFVSG